MLHEFILVHSYHINFLINIQNLLPQLRLRPANYKLKLIFDINTSELWKHHVIKISSLNH